MPLELQPMTPDDALAWTRIRALAYYGPVHDLLHTGPISESSILGVAQDRKRELSQSSPTTWHWKIVDTDSSPSSDDPPTNGGRTIAIAIWTMRNPCHPESKETSPSLPADHAPPKFLPPELKLDALTSLLQPLRNAQTEIMDPQIPYFKLDSLATHPDHQGRGAATMLLDWGLRKADKEELLLYLNASVAGKRLYDKRGFEAVREVKWDLGAWGGEGEEVHVCMVRRPQKGVLYP